VRRLITEDLPRTVSTNTAYRNAIKNSDKPNARIEHDAVLKLAVNGVIKDDTQFYKRSRTILTSGAG